MSDYGLAKELKPGEKTYSLAGTPDYVSNDSFIQVHKLSQIKGKPLW